MFEQDKLSSLLDILGNRNRRRILELLRQKPCFVTEISEKLLINPKAVIEHLAIMQKEEVISSYQDERRRKYYYITQDFTLSVEMKDTDNNKNIHDYENMLPLTDKIMMVQKMLESREHLIDQLESVEKDINRIMDDIIVSGRRVFENNVEEEALLTLIYSPLTPIEISDTCGRSIPEVTAALRSLISKGYIESKAGRYNLKNMTAPPRGQ